MRTTLRDNRKLFYMIQLHADHNFGLLTDTFLLIRGFTIERSMSANTYWISIHAMGDGVRGCRLHHSVPVPGQGSTGLAGAAHTAATVNHQMANSPARFAFLARPARKLQPLILSSAGAHREFPHIDRYVRPLFPETDHPVSP